MGAARNAASAPLASTRIDGFLILVPLRLRTVHRQEVQGIIGEHEPDRDRDRTSRFSAGNADRDLSIPDKAFFQTIAARGHVQPRFV